MDDDAILSEFYDDFVKAMRLAEEDFKTLASGLFAIADPALRAQGLNFLIWRRVREIFTPREHRISRYRNQNVLYIGDKAKIIFKKLRGNLRSSAYPTRQSTAFRLQLSFEGMPQKARNYIIGYTLNKLRTAVEEFWATRTDGSKIEWSRRLDDSKQVGMPDPTNLPSPPPPAEAKGSKVRPKSTGQVIPMTVRKASGDD